MPLGDFCFPFSPPSCTSLSSDPWAQLLSRALKEHFFHWMAPVFSHHCPQWLQREELLVDSALWRKPCVPHHTQCSVGASPHRQLCDCCPEGEGAFILPELPAVFWAVLLHRHGVPTPVRLFCPHLWPYLVEHFAEEKVIGKQRAGEKVVFIWYLLF